MNQWEGWDYPFAASADEERANEARAEKAEAEKLLEPTCKHGAPNDGADCKDCEREEAEEHYLSAHPPGSACNSGCGYCGRCA